MLPRIGLATALPLRTAITVASRRALRLATSFTTTGRPSAFSIVVPNGFRVTAVFSRGFAAKAAAGAGEKKPKKKTTTKAAATKKKPAKAKKAQAKKPKAKKKAAPKPKKAKRVVKKKVDLTPEQVKRKKILELNAKSLFKEQPKKLPASAYTVYLEEQRRTKFQKGVDDLLEFTSKAGADYKALSAAELAPLQAKAELNREANKKALAEFVKSQPPERIYEANWARLYLTRLGARNHPKLQDDRLPKRPRLAFIHFLMAKYPTMPDNLSMFEKRAAIADEWKTMSEAEKKPFRDLWDAENVRYLTERKTVLGPTAATEKL